jgi:hypothetical protein
VSSGIDWFDSGTRVVWRRNALNQMWCPSAADDVRLGDGSVGVLPDDWLERYGTLVTR